VGVGKNTGLWETIVHDFLNFHQDTVIAGRDVNLYWAKISGGMYTYLHCSMGLLQAIKEEFSSLMSAVLVMTLPGYKTLSPPHVNGMRCFLFFVGFVLGNHAEVHSLASDRECSTGNKVGGVSASGLVG
jgi:hypothetical protein